MKYQFDWIICCTGVFFFHAKLWWKTVRKYFPYLSYFSPWIYIIYFNMVLLLQFYLKVLGLPTKYIWTFEILEQKVKIFIFGQKCFIFKYVLQLLSITPQYTKFIWALSESWECTDFKYVFKTSGNPCLHTCLPEKEKM